MTDPRIAAAARAMYVQDSHDWPWGKVGPETHNIYINAAKAALAAADRAAWHPIEEYVEGPQQVMCFHAEKKWMRFGRKIFGRWYYSGTNERSQWAQVEGDEPTHFQPLPTPPTEETEG